MVGHIVASKNITFLAWYAPLIVFTPSVVLFTWISVTWSGTLFESTTDFGHKLLETVRLSWEPTVLFLTLGVFLQCWRINRIYRNFFTASFLIANTFASLYLIWGRSL